MKDLTIQTVLGPIAADTFGFVLPHEHVMCDFIGADQTGADRWNADEVVEVMAPYLSAIKDFGITGFVDCTPEYIGRDPLVLRRLAERTGLHIATNTGLYKEPYLPPYAFAETADQLAARWICELEHGIGATGIKPGFIKIAVNPGPLIPIQQKIVRAAARAHLATGAVIASHTAHGVAALEEIDILEEEGVDPRHLIVVHTDTEKDFSYHLQIARRGAWVEYDHLNAGEEQHYLEWIGDLIASGFADQLLLSHDAGWYWVGEEGGGQVNDFEYIPSRFIPALAQAGFDEALIRQLTVINPARAFAMAARG